jgi:hypothetical protein
MDAKLPTGFPLFFACIYPFGTTGFAASWFLGKGQLLSFVPFTAGAHLTQV